MTKQPRGGRPRKPASEKASKLIAFRLTPDEHRQAQDAARAQHRTVAGWVKALVLGTLDNPRQSGDD